MRHDPYQLPVLASHARGDELSYTIDRQGAVVKRKLSCGLAVSMALPARAFKGVAARAALGSDGAQVVTLELYHHDTALCVPLLVSDNLDDIAADWHAWSRLLKLPMLIIDGEQKASAMTKMLGALLVETPAERRKRLLRRRPRFLARRKTGSIGEVVRISGEELIARR